MALWPHLLLRRQLATSACFFLVGVSLFAVGAYQSFVNIAPQQARIKARNEFIKDRLRKLVDD